MDPGFALSLVPMGDVPPLSAWECCLLQAGTPGTFHIQKTPEPPQLGRRPPSNSSRFTHPFLKTFPLVYISDPIIPKYCSSHRQLTKKFLSVKNVQNHTEVPPPFRSSMNFPFSKVPPILPAPPTDHNLPIPRSHDYDTSLYGTRYQSLPCPPRACQS